MNQNQEVLLQVQYTFPLYKVQTSKQDFTPIYANLICISLKSHTDKHMLHAINGTYT